ncbi:MAG: hypothetical protein HLX50_00645 [Alteromonadaceae bacterium]|nr:hypothetical protein [Alteromonadaceae bacterium]
MPVIKVTKEMANITKAAFNIGGLVPYAVTVMNAIMVNHAEHYQHHFMNDNDGREPDWSLMEPRWHLQWATVATQLPDFLREVYPGLYGQDGPVEIGTVGDYVLLKDKEAPGAANAPISTNTNALYRLARRHRVTHLFDGEGFMTLDGDGSLEWFQVMLLRDIQFKMSGGFDFPVHEFAERFASQLEPLITFGDAELCPSWSDCQ